MRFHPEGPLIPDILLERRDAGRVVFLCGAGVSLPAGMPNFVDLTRHVTEYFDPPADSEIMAAFRPWLKLGSSAANMPLDQIFNLLHQDYGKDEVNSIVTERLSVSSETKGFGREHDLIKRVSSSQRGIPQIVTTNFDRLFEGGNETEELARYEPPAFPDLNFGSTIEGITYLHGRLVEATAETHPYVLSSADFGRAYLSEGWATNFVRHLLERYTVVLVGYQAEDPPIKYLLQGLNHDGQYDRSRLYAFDRGSPEEIEAKWRDRGVTAIAYAKHDDLWMSMEAWADRADDSRKWRASIIAKTQQDPKNLLPYERGQVAHVLRTVQGARLFSEAEPIPHPEWICVLDATVRSAKPVTGYGDNAEIFDPVAAYGLDDDLKDISDDQRTQGISNDNLLIWRSEDDNPHNFHRLGGREAEGFEAIPKRLGHLITWITKSIGSPVIAWWIIRQNGLHPGLLKQLQWQLERSRTLHKRVSHILNLIFEYHRNPRSHEWKGDWFDLKARIEAEGWTAGVLREFRKVSTPLLNITLPTGLGKSRPPSMPWQDIHLSDLGHFDVSFFDKHNEKIDVPDDLLPRVVSILEEHMVVASGMLCDIETSYSHTPTCYPHRDVEGGDYITKAADMVNWFVQLFDRMAVKWPKLAKAQATTWPVTDQFFFRKLKLYAFNKLNVFEADYVAAETLSLNQQELWDTDVTRELLFLLVDRWQEFSPENRVKITERILAGPDQLPHWSDDEFQELRDNYAARYARYLQLQGCKFTSAQNERLANTIRGISDWRDSWAAALVINRGTRVGWVGRDENPETILSLPVNEIVHKLKQDSKPNSDRFTEMRPFTGLVKVNPRKALSALTAAAKGEDYPTGFWSTLISDLPSDISPRLKKVFLHRLKGLPYAVIAELRGALSRWLEDHLASTLAFDEQLGWAVYDHIIDGVLSGGANATKSGLSEVNQGSKTTQRSRRTYGHAINGSVGMWVDALFNAVLQNEPEAGAGIPEHIKYRVERLFTVHGEGADHAVAVTASKLNWLMSLDPAWTESLLIPMLALDNPVSEPAWNGLLRNQVPEPQLAEIIKPHLIAFVLSSEKLAWNVELSVKASQWLGYMRVFHQNEPGHLSSSEMRLVLRGMSGDARNQFISWLRAVGDKNDSGWSKYVMPIINDDWPREHRYRTSASMRAWIGLLEDTGSCFPIVYEAVKKFMVPEEMNDRPFYRFTLESSDKKPLTVLYPEVTLDLINRTTPLSLSRSPYDLSRVLSLIAISKPGLTSDPRYLRLIDLVERS